MIQRTTPNLNIYTGNRLETLSEAMAKILSTPLASPFDPEIILVQSHGMARWVSMELACFHGISAHHKFYYPNEFINEVLQDDQTGQAEKSPYVPAVMAWRIMQLLPDCLDKPGFEPLAKYLEQDAVSIKSYQLGVRIADLFDQYLLFRPEMIFRWEKGEEDHWQAQLWREMIKNQTVDHRAALLYKFQTQVEKSTGKIIGLPQRISVFGISALPRFHMDVFYAISGFTEVNLFLVNPCREYWGVIQSDHEIKKKTRSGRVDDEWLYLEQGNRLLASLGTLGRDFFDLVSEFQCNAFELFDSVKEKNLLSRIQSDILNLHDNALEGEDRINIDARETSVMIHSCHSPMREVEVLHDQLLSMFEKDPELTPRDILVMTPDIENYAPYIKAVFLHASDPETRIPFSIADRSMLEESHVIKTVFLIFKLYQSRFKASDVLRIFESPPVLRTFDITRDDAALIRQWVSDTGIRWGQGAEDHARFDLPEYRENTWAAGIERLLLGYAMAGREENLFDGILPYDHIEGNASLVLGKFLTFTDRLFAFIASLDIARSLTGWSETLLAFLDTFFMQDDDLERDLREVRSAVTHLAELQEDADFSRKVPFPLVEHHLTEALSGQGFGSGFLTGGVTFCAMLPMRSIPFQVICLLGLNHDTYPRRKKTSGFDLIAKNPRPGDRSARLDDQYLFLESILSARKRLYISYIGQSIQDNSEIPPSVLVSELVDYIENGFSVQHGNIINHITVKHRLQPFHPQYFQKDDSLSTGLFSYSRESCLGAEYLMNPRQLQPPFFKQALPEPDDAWRHIHLEDLYLFFTNPCKYLMTRRLGVYLEEGRAEVEDTEAFTLNALEQYKLAQTLLEKSFSGVNTESYIDAVRASGRLPHGTVGTCIYDGLRENVSAFAENTRPFVSNTPLPSQRIDLNIGLFKISGHIHTIFPEHHLLFRYARIKAGDYIRLWLDHLILSILEPAGFSGKSILVGLDGKSAKTYEWKAWEISAADSPAEHLESLLNDYWEGLKQPPAFFPDTSLHYADQIITGKKDRGTALARAKTRYEGDMYRMGECNDFYIQMCFGHESPLDEVFESLALKIFQPVLNCLQEIK